MPNSKSAEVRIKVIDRCLSDRSRHYTTADIFNLCNEELERRDFKPISSMNSIRNDIEQIQRVYSGADVEQYCDPLDTRVKYYHYLDPNFSIYKSLLKPEETVQLIQTLGLLKRFRGMPQFNWVNEIADRLGTSLKVDEMPTEEVVGFDENLDLKGIEHFTPLFNAIIDHRTLRLTYKSFKAEDEIAITVHPYYLKQYNKRWFLIAWNDELDFMANYAFDRIISIADSSVTYRPTNVDFFDYFDDMVGVSKDSRTNPQLVKLWVSHEAWPYIKTKPLHGTQRVVQVDDNGAVITIEVYLNYELQQQLLSYGENVMVLEPKELHDTVKERLTKASDMYGK